MLANLIPQKVMDGVQCVSVRGDDPDDAPALSGRESVCDRRPESLHRCHTRRHFAVRHQRLLKVALAKRLCNLLKMRSNLIVGRQIGRVVGAHDNLATVHRQTEMMRGLALIEAHGHVAVLLHLGVFFHLGHVLFVCDPCGHRRMLLGGDDGHQWKASGREYRQEANR
jgi:hypothetical protein